MQYIHKDILEYTYDTTKSIMTIITPFTYNHKVPPHTAYSILCYSGCRPKNIISIEGNCMTDIICFCAIFDSPPPQIRGDRAEDFGSVHVALV